MQPGPSAYEFGPLGTGRFRFEPEEARLQCGDEIVNLEPKAVALLGHFLTRPGHLYARDELLDAVWGHRHVTPSTLNRIVTLLRQALGDDAAAPRYIETVPRRGYRFVADVRTDMARSTAGSQPVSEPASEPAPEPGIAKPLFRPPPLPAHVEAQVPREAELAALQALLDAARLLTVLGPGGIGKTELALELARRVADGYVDGAWLVDLTPCRDEGEVNDLLLTTFGLGKRADFAPAEQLAASLQARELLLLLDNCERVATACAGIAEALLQRCPGLRILATSQVRLGMEGEQDYRVPPLSLPPGDWERSVDPLATARTSEAVRLLEMRARESDPRFDLDADNIAAVVGLCRHLEGLPLALELAASRLRVLGPHELLERLVGRDEVLVADWHGGPERQRTVRDMLDWSFHLLSADEAQLLQRLSLFSGGWTLEGAEALMRESEGAHDVVGPLGSLVDKSFVVVEHKARPRRFRMLEAVREYALERVEQDPDVDAYRRRHLQHFLALGARADAVLYAQPMHWYGHWIDREQANLRLAFEFALQHGLHEQALELALNLRWYWWVVGDTTRSMEWIQIALARHPAPSTAARARALQFIGTLELHRARFEVAEPLLVEAIAAARASALHPELGMALAALGMVRIAAGQRAPARRLLSQAMREALAIGDDRVLGYARIWAAVMHSLDDSHRLAWLSLRRAVGELAALRREPGSAPGFLLGFAQVNLGLQALYLGDLNGAARAFDAGLSLGTILRNVRVSAAALEGFGYVLGRCGEPALSARLLGSAEALRELTGVPMFRHWHQAHRETLKALRHALDGEAERLLEGGRRERLETLQAALYAAYPSLGLATPAIAASM